jgi:hypothetical protein
MGRSRIRTGLDTNGIPAVRPFETTNSKRPPVLKTDASFPQIAVRQAA